VFEGQFFDPIIKLVMVILCDPCRVVRGDTGILIGTKIFGYDPYILRNSRPVQNLVSQRYVDYLEAG
jgi:hypothetical protein